MSETVAKVRLSDDIVHACRHWTPEGGVDRTRARMQDAANEIEALREVVRLTVAGVYENRSTFCIEDKDYTNHVVSEAVFRAANRVIPQSHVVVSRDGSCAPNCPAPAPHIGSKQDPS